jgi:5'-nucleotidase
VPPGEIRGSRITHQGIRIARTTIIEGVDPRGRPYYWIGEQQTSWKQDEGSDFAAIEQGLVSITPLRTDMTDYRALETLRNWNGFSLNGKP